MEISYLLFEGNKGERFAISLAHVVKAEELNAEQTRLYLVNGTDEIANIPYEKVLEALQGDGEMLTPL